MFKVIGTDQKEYGPIDDAGLRQWLEQGRLHAQSLVKPEGAQQWVPLRSLPGFASAAGPPPIPPPAVSGVDDTVATLIPYRNPKALIAYYLGIFSLFPIIGMFLGIAAVVLGLQGLRFARENAESKGKVHAWVGIICGGIFGLFYLLVNGAIVVVMLKG